MPGVDIILVSSPTTGYDLRPYVDFRRLEIEEGFSAKSDILRFEITIPYSDLQAGLVIKPRFGHIIMVSIDDMKEFEGIVIQTEDRFLNPKTMDVAVECWDYTHLLDKRLVTQSYGFQTASDRVIAVLTEFAPLFAQDTTYIQTNDYILPPQEYDHELVSSVLDNIAESIGYQWYVDSFRRVHFAPSLVELSPLSANYNNILDADTNPEIFDLIVNEDGSNLHNTVIIKDFKQRASQGWNPTVPGEIFVGEGSARTFYALQAEPWPDLSSMSVTVNGSPRTLQVDLLDGGQGGTASFDGLPGYAYVNFEAWGVRFPNVDLPGTGSIVNVQYDYVLPDQSAVFFDATSQQEITYRSAYDDDGEYQAMISLPDWYVDRPSQTSPQTTVEIYAQQVLGREAWPVISGKFSTYMRGWRSSQMFELTSNVRDIYDPIVYANSGHTLKVPVKVWTQRVRKTVQALTPGGSVQALLTEVEFSDHPYRR